MRPVGSGGADGVPRKPSFPSTASANPQGNMPTSFFLARESDMDARPTYSSSEETSPPTVHGLDKISEVSNGSDTAAAEVDSHRRRSTLKPTIEVNSKEQVTQNNTGFLVQEPLTPLLAASPGDISLPSSPKSASGRSLQNADLGSLSDDLASQAVVSSGDEEEDLPEIQDSAPQLIMPSIKMPSRRPFTEKGRELGRLKIMVAGSKGVGKTSLIKSIVQTCEDIVHVDPVGSSIITPVTSTLIDKSASTVEQCTEIYASTKPYPAWWSEFDESRVLRRRKSLGDAVLERNICFVDTTSAKTGQSLVHYLEQQLQAAINATSAAGTDFVSLLSGRGGMQVDLILFLVSKDTLYSDIDIVRLLSELSNVIPVIAKSDLLTPETISSMKQEIRSGLNASTLRPFTFPEGITDQPPFAVSAALSPDNETMDASLLMSPEYVQPLVQSELATLVKRVFEKDTLPFLRHSAAKRLVTWRSKHPFPIEVPSPTPSSSPRPSTLGSPVLSSMSASGALVPRASDVSLTTSNSFTLARVADHVQQEEHLAQVRLAKWATDLQQSLRRERERYERIARGERAVWLVERMGEEVRNGRLQPFERSLAKLRNRGDPLDLPTFAHPAFTTNDPIGLLKWNDELRRKSWVALQVLGSFGVIGGLALWLARTWGFTAGEPITEHGTYYHWKW